MGIFLQAMRLQDTVALEPAPQDLTPNTPENEQHRSLVVALAAAAACTSTKNDIDSDIDADTADTAVATVVEPTSDYFIEIEPEQASQNGGPGEVIFRTDISAGSSDIVSGVDATETARFDGQFAISINEIDRENARNDGPLFMFAGGAVFFDMDFSQSGVQAPATALDLVGIELAATTTEDSDTSFYLGYYADWQDQGDGTFSLDTQIGRVTPIDVACTGEMPEEGQIVEEMQCTFTRTFDPSDSITATMHRN